MCDQHNTYPLLIKGIGVVGVDECIGPLVEMLNSHGFATVASCCGHGHRPGDIALEDGRELVIAPDYATARKVEKAFPISVYGEVVGDLEGVSTREDEGREGLPWPQSNAPVLTPSGSSAVDVERADDVRLRLATAAKWKVFTLRKREFLEWTDEGKRVVIDMLLDDVERLALYVQELVGEAVTEVGHDDLLPTPMGQRLQRAESLLSHRPDTHVACYLSLPSCLGKDVPAWERCWACQVTAFLADARSVTPHIPDRGMHFRPSERDE